MGLLDIITGKRKLAQPAPDRLFAMTTAYVQLQTELGITSRGAAAIVFQQLSTADFSSIIRDTEELVRATAADSNTTVDRSDDQYGFSWLILRGTDFDQLVVGINAVSGEIEAGGYGERLLCAVFAFEDERKRPLYWIYNYKRGAFYPFIPGSTAPSVPGGAGGLGAPGTSGSRDSEREFQLRAQVGGELPVEQELERWFPLWGIPI